MTSANDGPVEQRALTGGRIAIDQNVIRRQSYAFELKIWPRHAFDTATSVSACC